MRAPLRLLSSLAAAMLLAGCTAFPGGEGLGDGSHEDAGEMPPAVQTREYRGVLNVSAATGQLSAGDTLPLEETLGTAFFEGFTAVLAWNSTQDGVEPPQLQVSFRAVGSVHALAHASGKAPLALKVDPSLLEGLEGPFELFVSASGNQTLPVTAATRVPYTVTATQYFGPEGADAFAAFA